MNNRLKYPLSLYVVWHPDFKEGKIIANNLYSIFCRDVEQPLLRGLGIPVYYRSVSSQGEPIPIDADSASRNAIVLLIDQNYIIDPDFQEYTKSLIKLVDDNTRIYPIALCRQAYALEDLNSYQFIRAYQGDLAAKENFDFSMKKIKTELLHDCARLLMNIQSTWEDRPGDRVPSPVKLFLSHAKKDGLETTRKFKAFIDAELKLDVFFDTVDIADGYEFERQIEENIKKNTALVVFHTDEYSAREWCRIEVLLAKRNKCPIVVVHDVKSGERRAFPYLGNTPTIVLQSNETQSFIEIVNLTLYQVINNLFQNELLDLFRQRFNIKEDEFISLTSPPELFNYIDIYKMKKGDDKPILVLYPEPPLGAEELKVLNEINNEIKFITPIHLPTLG